MFLWHFFNRPLNFPSFLANLIPSRCLIRIRDPVLIFYTRHYRNQELAIWNQTKENTRSSVSLSFKDYMTKKTSSLNERLKWLAANSNKLDRVSLEKGKLSLARIEKDFQKKQRNLVQAFIRYCQE